MKPKNILKNINKKKLIIWGSISAVIVALAVIVIFTMPKGGNEKNGIPEQMQVVRRDITATIKGTATVKPKDQYSITSLVSGKIVASSFEEGDMVNKGDVLYKFDASSVEKNIAGADVNLRKAQNSYNDAAKDEAQVRNNLNVVSDVSGIIKELYVKSGDMVQSGTKIADIYDDSTMELVIPFNESDISGIFIGNSAFVTVVGSSDILSGMVSSINNASYAKAGNMLVQDVVIQVKNPGVITPNDKGAAEINGIACNDSGQFRFITEKSINAKTTGEVAKINIQKGNRIASGAVIVSLKNDTIKNNTAANALSIEEAKINKEKTISQLDDYTIIAPISGQVITKNIKAGDTLDNTNKQEPMAIIYDLSSLEFDMMIDELDINKISIGQEVNISADALDGREYTGVVQKISVKGTSANGVTSYPVTVVISDFDSHLMPGMNIDVEIAIGTSVDVIAIPKSAVTRDNIVYVAGEKDDPLDDAPDGYKSVSVVSGLNDGRYIEIISGLSDTDIVKIETINTNRSVNLVPDSGGER